MKYINYILEWMYRYLTSNITYEALTSNFFVSSFTATLRLRKGFEATPRKTFWGCSNGEAAKSCDARRCPAKLYENSDLLREDEQLWKRFDISDQRKYSPGQWSPVDSSHWGNGAILLPLHCPIRGSGSDRRYRGHCRGIQFQLTWIHYFIHWPRAPRRWIFAPGIQFYLLEGKSREKERAATRKPNRSGCQSGTFSLESRSCKVKWFGFWRSFGVGPPGRDGAIRLNFKHNAPSIFQSN